MLNFDFLIAIITVTIMIIVIVVMLVRLRIIRRSLCANRQHSDQQDQCQAHDGQVLKNVLHITFLLQLCFQMSIMGYGRSP